MITKSIDEHLEDCRRALSAERRSWWIRLFLWTLLIGLLVPACGTVTVVESVDGANERPGVDVAMPDDRDEASAAPDGPVADGVAVDAEADGDGGVADGGTGDGYAVPPDCARGLSADLCAGCGASVGLDLSAACRMAEGCVETANAWEAWPTPAGPDPASACSSSSIVQACLRALIASACDGGA